MILANTLFKHIFAQQVPPWPPPSSTAGNSLTTDKYIMPRERAGRQLVLLSIHIHVFFYLRNRYMGTNRQGEGEGGGLSP